MKNIHILPTDKSSRLSIKDSVLILHRLQWRKGTHHIYITSDEEIKEGNWVITPTKDIIQWAKVFQPDGKKIILTTDQDLIKDGVQAIDDEFLEWFVKNPSCEEVQLEVDLSKHNGQFQTKYGYRIIIPKEEPKQKYSDSYGKKDDELRSKILNQYLDSKEGTLEKAITKGFIKTSKEIDYTEFDWTSFKLGAKWQAERMYSEEDLIELLNFVTKEYNISNGIGWFHTHNSIEDISSKEVLEQFKKK